MTKQSEQSKPSAAVWILRIENQPNAPMITVMSRSELLAPGPDTVARYRDIDSATGAIAESAAQFLKRCACHPDD
ncbi:hypothetical protein SAMN05421678_12623 [Actinopolymorpha cephalotaxi]|uniref:Uncharacterized protein n=1 Tax=Actinopolymorpha cephalotaxi TaxID=504797 RepID=A0A1I3BRG9_9ACTN|nr:hypothetical protein [Actinopolymorpha cephalotaxi]NYH83766.1 hypothetical protein [Actinopolymorpha cephalotaxi]SFH64833.1 hypothetical protein SAMN05421678_12623 [Actinopolymorpha cephalotaxi]